RERETPDPHRAGTSRDIGGLVGHPSPGGLGAGAGQVGEAAGPAGDGLVHAPQGRDREALAVRLLPAEPAVARQPRREDRRARILQIDGDGDADQPPPLTGPGEEALERGEGGFGARDYWSRRDRVIATSPVRAIS